MFQLDITEKFKKSRKKFHPNDQKSINNAIRLLSQGKPFHPSLRTKPIKSTSGIYEATANSRIRISWEYHPNYSDTLRIRNVDEHDLLLNNP